MEEIQPSLSNIGWQFDNSYARLPELMMSRVKPVKVQSPKNIRNNESLKHLDLNVLKFNYEFQTKVNDIEYNDNKEDFIDINVINGRINKIDSNDLNKKNLSINNIDNNNHHICKKFLSFQKFHPVWLLQ